MWQQLIVGVLVLVAVVYAARKLGPRRWRAKGNAVVAAGGCGCDKGASPCLEAKKPGALSG
jgi:Na+/glutamate symporter